MMNKVIHARKYDLGLLLNHFAGKTTTGFCGKSRIPAAQAIVNGEITCPDCRRALGNHLKVAAEIARKHPEHFQKTDFFQMA